MDRAYDNMCVYVSVSALLSMNLGNLCQGLHLLSGALECGEALTWQIVLILHEHATPKQTLQQQ